MEHQPSPRAHVASAVPVAPAVSAASAPRVWLGLTLLLVSALIFSLHNAAARLAYDEGVTPTTITAMRTWAIVILFALLFGSRGHWPKVPRAAWAAFAVTAIAYSIHNPLLLIAFQFIPVSLAVLVLYLFPLLVGFMAAAIGLERLKRHTLAAAAVAFIGVALVLETGRAALDWRGLALAAISAVALAGNIVGAAELNRHLRALAVSAVMDLKSRRL